MNSSQKIDAAVFVYNYLRNLYDLPYHGSLADENIIWGFTSVDRQTCLVNVANVAHATLNEIFDEIENRQTANIKLITSIYSPKPKIWTKSGFAFMSSKSVLKYNYPKGKYKEDISDFGSKAIENTIELTDLLKFNVENIYISRLEETLHNLILLINVSLITVEFIYSPDSEKPFGLFIIFPSKAFIIVELILFSSAFLNQKQLRQLVRPVLGNKNLNNNKPLIVIVSQNWKEIYQDKIVKVGEIQYYEKQKIKNPLPEIPICLKSAVLKTKPEFLNSVKIINSLGLPKHNDLPKNWDTLAALSQIVNDTLIGKDSAILDAGGELYSAILYQLASYGYTNLHCVNLAFNSTVKVGSIIYQKGDVTETTFEDNTFSAVTCLSVIEHIVNIEKYFCEMSRIIKEEGILFISTDYWKDAIDTHEKKSYGNPFKIYDDRGIKQLVDIAKEFKLELMEPQKLSCKNKVVSCDGFKYTFLYLTFKKITL